MHKVYFGQQGPSREGPAGPPQTLPRRFIGGAPECSVKLRMHGMNRTMHVMECATPGSIGRSPRIRTSRDAHIASTQWPGQCVHDIMKRIARIATSFCCLTNAKQNPQMVEPIGMNSVRKHLEETQDRFKTSLRKGSKLLVQEM